VLDPISNFMSVGSRADAKAMLVRLLDHLKVCGITALLTCLTSGAMIDETEIGISSLIDTWIQVRDFESGGERNHGLYVLKSRGMAHSNQVREFIFTPKGIELVDIRLGPGGVLTGSARVAREAEEQAESVERKHQIERRRRDLERRRRDIEAEIAVLRNDLAAEEEDMANFVEQEVEQERRLSEGKVAELRRRGARRDRESEPAPPGAPARSHP
jgi:circadian clock protein KaiC